MDRELEEYVARESSRRYGPIGEDLPRKLRRNLRRKHGVTVPLDELGERARHFKEIYLFAAPLLTEYLQPPSGKYAQLADVRLRPFLDAIAARYPQESQSIIEMIVWYVIFYEYLK